MEVTERLHARAHMCVVSMSRMQLYLLVSACRLACGLLLGCGIGHACGALSFTNMSRHERPYE